MTSIAWAVWATNLDKLYGLAQCDERGWITVRFPMGGEYLCTLVKGEPAPVSRPRRSLKPAPPATPVLPPPTQ